MTVFDHEQHDDFATLGRIEQQLERTYYLDRVDAMHTWLGTDLSAGLQQAVDSIDLHEQTALARALGVYRSAA